MEGGGEMESSYTPIISGLPDDIALFCLARVPRRYHHVLKCVSRRWRALICGETWHLYRREHNLDEAWVYALCRDNEGRTCFYLLDAERRCWKPFHDVMPQFLKRTGIACEALGKKLYLLGGCRLVEDASDEVCCYDASTNSWEEAAPLKTARYHLCLICISIAMQIFRLRLDDLEVLTHKIFFQIKISCFRSFDLKHCQSSFWDEKCET